LSNYPYHCVKYNSLKTKLLKPYFMKKITLFFALFFISLQSNSQIIYSENFDTALNWTVLHPTGTSTLAGWSRVTAGTNPTITPAAGAGMARFNSYDVTAGNAYSLTSPAITFSGANYRVKLKMYRDNGYTTDADRIRIYLNSVASSVGGTLLGTINRSISLSPAVSENGWYTYYFDFAPGVTGDKYISILGTSAYGNNVFIDEVSVIVTPTNEAEMATLNFAPVIATIGNNAVGGSIKNVGGNQINSVDINWQVDGGATYTQALTGLTIAPGATYNYNHSDQWNAVTGLHTLRVWLSNTNGGDTDTTNNEIVKSIYVVNEIFPKTVVYEEATGGWCQFCPRGHVGLKDMEHNHPGGSFIGIAVHNQDPMALAAYDTAIGAFIGGYPSGTINRNNSETDPGLSSLEPAYQEELAKTPLGKIAIPDANWDPTTRQITFDATAQFAVDIPNANYNMAAIIVENDVTGTATAYRQVNAYSGSANVLVDWEGVNWNTLPNPVPAATMVYDHVGRALLGGFNGVAGSVPTSVSYNAPYSYSFTHTLPVLQDETQIEIVAILIDNVTGQIVNADSFDLGAKILLANNSFTKGKFQIFPNPTTGQLNLNTEQEVSVSIIDVLGKVVFSKDKVTKESGIDLSSLTKGIYLAKINGDNINFTEKIILN
jgi:hypothetical protein